MNTICYVVRARLKCNKTNSVWYADQNECLVCVRYIIAISDHGGPEMSGIRCALECWIGLAKWMNWLIYAWICQFILYGGPWKSIIDAPMLRSQREYRQLDNQIRQVVGMEEKTKNTNTSSSYHSQQEMNMIFASQCQSYCFDCEPSCLISLHAAQHYFIPIWTFSAFVGQHEWRISIGIGKK